MWLTIKLFFFLVLQFLVDFLCESCNGVHYHAKNNVSYTPCFMSFHEPKVTEWFWFVFKNCDALSF